MRLENKTAVITGCLQGIGLASLDLFVKNGATVFACCQKETDGFKAYCQKLKEEEKAAIIPIYFDLNDEEAIKEAARSIQKTKKKIDVLVNVAGITRDALFPMVSMKALKETFQINFFSQILLTQYMTKLMLKNKKGTVINIASIAGIDGNPGQLSYAASKAALISATKTLSQELGPQGIRVNAIAPGVIKTAMTQNLSEETLNRLLLKSDLKRLGLPEEVAATILYLASDSASYITGQVLRVDGGIG